MGTLVKIEASVLLWESTENCVIFIAIGTAAVVAGCLVVANDQLAHASVGAFLALVDVFAFES